MMLKFLLSAFKPAAPSKANDQETILRWRRDPLSHPVLEVMTQRELGDLPFSR